MLDLNLSVVRNEEDPATIEEKFLEGSRGQMDESATSNSSVVNAEASSYAGDDDSCLARDIFAFSFDFLKVGGEFNNASTDEGIDNRMTHSAFVTRQLFPVTGDGRLAAGQISIPSSASLSRPNRIDLPPVNQSGPGGLQEVRVVQQQQRVKKSRRGPRSRSSQYRGVTFYRRTGRWESHIWDCGKQVYLGGFDTAHAAARVYDRAAIKFRGVDADINFNLSDYEDDLKRMKNLTKEEFVHILRRQSTGFSRGSSKYRGVTLHKCGRWEARMGQFLGKKAYDKAAIKFNGREAITNFESTAYEGEMISEASDGGSSHNLDLNLGISTPSSGNGPMNNESLGHLQFHPYNAHEARKSNVEHPATPTVGNPTRKGLAISSEHPSLWTRVYPSFFPNFEKRAKANIIEGGSSQMSPNWVWQMHDQIGVTPLTFSSAASSGFSSAATTALFASNHQSKLPNPTSLDLCFSSSATASGNSQYYQMRPLQPPP